jgi:hypothetical protein
LTWESEAAGNTWNTGRDQVVKITISGGGKLKGSEADIIESFVINTHNLISVFDELMDWKGGVVWLNDGIWDLGGWDDWEGSHDSVGIFFSDLGDEEGSHTWSSTTTEWVGDLESLEAVATFSFLSNNVENWINEFSTLGIVTLGPVVTGTTLSEDEVVRSEELTEWASSDWVHCAWFQVHKDGSGDVSSTSSFVVVNVDSFKLKIWVSVIGTSWVNTVFIWNDFPELGSDLVTALTSLNVDDFSHSE